MGGGRIFCDRGITCVPGKAPHDLEFQRMKFLGYFWPVNSMENFGDKATDRLSIADPLGSSF